MVTLVMVSLVIIVGVVIEWRIVRNLPWLYDLVKKHSLAGLGLSLSISMALGFVFGLASFVAAIGGLTATVITGIIYAIAGKRAEKPKNKQLAADFMATYRPFFKAVKWLFIILTSPIWVPVKVRTAIKGHA